MLYSVDDGSLHIHSEDILIEHVHNHLLIHQSLTVILFHTEISICKCTK